MPHPWLPPAVPGTVGHAALTAVHRLTAWGGVNRQTCRAVFKDGRRCEGPVLSGVGSDMCRRHAGPAASKLRREREHQAMLAGKVAPEAWQHSEIRRLRNRICNRRRYKRGWWAAGITLAFGAGLEAAFQADAATVLGDRQWEGLPDATRDRLRWGWRRYMLDRPRPEAWRAKAQAALLEADVRGAAPHALEHDPGSGAHVTLVTRRPFGHSLRTIMPEDEVARVAALPGQVLGQDRQSQNCEAAESQ